MCPENMVLTIFGIIVGSFTLVALYFYLRRDKDE